MTIFTPADKLHRLVKQALDSGAASSIAEAQALFAGYRVTLRIADDAARDPHHQTALLTCIALARRVFLGGVTIVALPQVKLLTPLPFGETLLEATLALGAPSPRPQTTRLHRDRRRTGPASVRSTSARSLPAGGAASCRRTRRPIPCPAPAMSLAPMLSAALAINEAFLFVSGASAFAGRRPLDCLCGLPRRARLACRRARRAGNAAAALETLADRPRASGPGLSLGARLTTLRAASASTAGAAGHRHHHTVDREHVDPLRGGAIGRKKTRTMAAWCECRGFETVIHERLFDALFRRQDNEPAVALCGLDNALGRQALDQVGFDFVVEAGLGRGHRDFRAIRLHTLPGSRSATQIWRGDAEGEQVDDRPAYTRMLERGELDRCGVTLLAGKAVGAPFVGVAAATLVLAELLRLLHGGNVHELIDLDLKFPEYRSVVLTNQDFGAFNPGYVPALHNRRSEWRNGYSNCC